MILITLHIHGVDINEKWKCLIVQMHFHFHKILEPAALGFLIGFGQCLVFGTEVLHKLIRISLNVAGFECDNSHRYWL